MTTLKIFEEPETMTWGDIMESYRKTPYEAFLYKFILHHSHLTPPPSDVYLLPGDEQEDEPHNGNLVLEWRLPGGVIHRVEFEKEVGIATFMTTFDKDLTYARSKPEGGAVFGDVS